MEKVRLTITGLTADVTTGLSRKEISEKYGLAPTQIKKAMDMAGLKGIRAKVDKFELVDDTIIPMPTQVMEQEETGYRSFAGDSEYPTPTHEM